ncbi:MAG: hypothetical protein Alpg2KO_15400 [Alphaproteobacteria bacterium]
MMDAIKRLASRRGRRGAGVSEYGLVVGLVSVITLIAVQTVGERSNNLYQDVAGSLAEPVTAFNASGVSGASSAGSAAAPTPTPHEHHFTFTAGQHPTAGTSFTGLAQQGFRNEGDYGTVLSESGLMTNMVASEHLSSNGRRTFYFDNDIRTQIAGLTVSCDDGFSANVDTADFNHYLPFDPDYTAIWWNGIAQAQYMTGQTYSCWME